MKRHDDCAGLILAAGKGTRMHSEKPKVLHTLLGEPMLAYALASAREALEHIFVVAGHKADLLAQAFPHVNFILQKEQLGTGHALATAIPVIEQSGCEYLFVINGDTPLVTAGNISDFIDKSLRSDLTFASIRLDDPGAFGRVTRKDGKVAAIIEAKDFNPDLHGEPTGEINAGMYVFRISKIKPLLPQLKNDNKNGEYYITDLVGLALAAGLKVDAVDMGHDASLLGINSPAELAAAEETLRQKIINRLLSDNIILHMPQSIEIGPLAEIEPGAEIFGPCKILGKSRVAANALIESFCHLRDVDVDSFATIKSFCHLEEAVIKRDAIIGPYARLRPGAVVDPEAHVGNFVELKKTRLGPGSKANHLTYLGDSSIGAGVNIGAGTITCNYDGKNKFQTSIGDNAFIGSNTALVAPVAIGENSLVGAGSVITRDVPPNSLAIERNRQKVFKRKIF